MAVVPDPSEGPQGQGAEVHVSSGGGFGLHGNSAGDLLPRAVEQLGSALTHAGETYGLAAANQAQYGYQDDLDKLLYGDPGKPRLGPDGNPVLGPDNKPMADTGFMGLNGQERAAASQQVYQQMQQLRDKYRSQLFTMDSQNKFDEYSRRAFSMASQNVGKATDAGYHQWMTESSNLTTQQGKDIIASDPKSDSAAAAGADAILRGADLKAKLMGASPGSPMYNQIMTNGMTEVYTMRGRELTRVDPEAGLDYVKDKWQKMGQQGPIELEQAKKAATPVLARRAGDQAWFQSSAGVDPKNFVVAGDSTANGVKIVTGARGTAIDGASPEQTLEYIKSTPREYVEGKTFIIGTGVYNNKNGLSPKQMADYVDQEIKTARDLGAKDVRIMGVSDAPAFAPLKTLLQEAAVRNKVEVSPLVGPFRSDNVHPANWEATARAAFGAPASGRLPEPPQPGQASSAPAPGATGYGAINAPYRAPLEAKGEKGIVSPAEHFQYLKSIGASNNEALMLTGAAASESSFNATAIHDNGNGYGLYGHNTGRLDLRGQDWQGQAKAALSELRQRPEHGIIESAQTPEQIALAEMHFEQPRGFSRLHPEAGDNYTGRLNTIKYFSQMANGVFSGAQGAPIPGQSGGGGSPQDRRGRAQELLANDTSLDPEVRERAIRDVNERYNITESETAAERQTYRSTVPSIIHAVEDGAITADKANINWDRVKEVMPEATANLWQSEMSAASAAGETVKGLQWAPKDDVSKALGDLYNGTGVMGTLFKSTKTGAIGPGASTSPGEDMEADVTMHDARLRVAGRVARWAQKREEELEKDPAQVVMQHPTVQPAFAAMQKNPNDPVAAQAYANATLGVQMHMGASNPQILPKGMAVAMGEQWSKAPAEGQATKTVHDMEAQANLWGKNWGKVYQEIAPHAGSLGRMIGAGTTNRAGEQLLENAATPSEEILKQIGEPDVTKKKIDEASSSAVKPFASTLAGPGRSQVFADAMDTVTRLTAIRARDNGTTPDVEAPKAFNDLIGFKYDFTKTYRVPKSIGVPLATIQAGVIQATANLGNTGVLSSPDAEPMDRSPLAVRPDVSSDPALQPENLMRDTISSLKANGVWVTDPSEEGLMLFRSGGNPALRPDGTPVRLSWGQLASLGTAAASASAHGNPLPTSWVPPK